VLENKEGLCTEQKNPSNIMSRRRAAEKRTIIPDHKYKDTVLAKFMNRIMLDGKKSVSEKIVYGAFDIVSNKTDKSPIDFFHEALNNVKPSLEVRSRRVGGATYQVPVEVKSKRSQALALRWLIDASRKRKDKNMSDKIFNEIFDAYQNRGSAIKKKEDTHKMAESNKAFAHFRW